MKQVVSNEIKQQVLKLRHTHSLAEVAKLTGLPVGTVKTICSRSGAFRDNMTHRALFSLPPIKESAETLPAVPELPPQRTVTGDTEVDAVIWLREVISTGQVPLIDKAMEARKAIKTPMKELEKRYSNWLIQSQPGNFLAGIASIGFDNLEGLAKSSVTKLATAREARSRFGDDLFADTPAELFCIAALHGIDCDGIGFANDDEADRRFLAHPEVLPNTLADCLHELAYWDALYSLRNSVSYDGANARPSEAFDRELFLFRMLGRIKPRSKDEAMAVLRWILDHKETYMGRGENTDAVLSNLIR